MSAPTPAPPSSRLLPVQHWEVAQVSIGAIDRGTHWTIAAIGPHDSVVLDELPTELVAPALRLAYDSVAPAGYGVRYVPITPACCLVTGGTAVNTTVVNARDPRAAGLLLALDIPRPALAIPRRVARTRLDVACDASRSRVTGYGGVAAVTSDGRYAVIPVSSSGNNIGRLEMRAIATAVDRFGGEHVLRITSDSLWAVQAINGERADLSSRDARDAGALRQRMLEGGHTVRWVRGHNGDRMNEIADRLAVAVRRSGDYGIHRQEPVKEMLSRIASEAVAA